MDQPQALTVDQKTAVASHKIRDIVSFVNNNVMDGGTKQTIVEKLQEALWWMHASFKHEEQVLQDAMAQAEAQQAAQSDPQGQQSATQAPQSSSQGSEPPQ